MLLNIVDVTAITGQKIASPLTSWQTSNGPYNVEHLAGMSPAGDLLVFWWSPQHDWQSVNVSQITGQKIASPLTSWQTLNGPYNVEHLAGMSPTGDLLVFWWSPQHDWQSVNVSQITGQKIASALTSWQTPNGPYNVEHLAGMSPSGDLLVFWWSPQHDWQPVNVSQITGQKVASPLTSWQTPNGPYLVEHLAGMSPAGDLLVFWWSPQHDWQSVNVSGTAGEPAALKPASHQLPDGQENVEVLCSNNPLHSLLLFWWKPSLDWQVMDLTEITGRSIYSAPESWLTPDGNRTIEHIAAEGDNNSLLVFWFDSEPRHLFETEGEFTTHWLNIGPRNITCVILGLAVDPTNPNLVYAASQCGGVWRSFDGGKRWVPTMDHETNLNVGGITLCRTSPSILYVGMNGATNNVYRSNDHATSWTPKTNVPSTSCRAIAVHPTKPDIVYFAGDKSLHKSIDGGMSWPSLTTAVDGITRRNSSGIFDGSIYDVKIDPDNPDTVYIAVENMGVFKTTDGGATWARKGAGVSFNIADDNGKQQTVQFDATFRTLLSIGEDRRPGMSGTQFIAAKVQGTILVSTTGGDNWRVLPGTDHGHDNQNFWDSCIAVCPADQNFIVAGGDHIDFTLNASAANPVWNPLTTSLHVDQQSICFTPSNPADFYFANDGYIGKATAHGSAVSKVSDGLVASLCFNVAVTQGPNLVAGCATYHTGIIRTGRNSFPVWEGIDGPEGGPFEIDPTNDEIFFCSPWGQNKLHRSRDSGSHWDYLSLLASVNGELQETYIGNLAIRPDDSRKLYASGFFGNLHYSLDGGTSWNFIKNADNSPWLFDGGNARGNGASAFAFDPKNGQNLYVGTMSGRLWNTTIGAVVSTGWQMLNTPNALSSKSINAIAVHPSIANGVYIGYGIDDNHQIYRGIRQPDGSLTWTDISGLSLSLPRTPINAIVIDPNHASRIFVATGVGIYETKDEGISWQPFMTGMPGIRVFALRLRNRTRVLYAAAYGRGVYWRWIGN